MENLEASLQVNRFARRNRHLRVFSRKGWFKFHFRLLFSYVLAPAKALFGKILWGNLTKASSLVGRVSNEFMPIAPQKRLLFNASVLGTIVLVGTSLAPSGDFSASSITYASEYSGEYDIQNDLLIADDSGYLVKANPQTDQSNRIGLSDFAVHTVETGESLSMIATKYGVKVETIMWENGLANANSIRVGQKLLVPPVDGVSYKVASGDTLSKIAVKYSITKEAIVAQNALGEESISKDQLLFLPGAKPIITETAIATTRGSSGTRDKRSYAGLSGSSSSPAIGKMFIFPTVGTLTQQFHAGHYALDIGNRSEPPIWAAAEGVVTKASSGTYGGGYGNHVIIDHGNGVKTLYGHMTSLNVVVGQKVKQGDIIGIMGHTGRVYGVTGIHLHWEVIVNGVKVNPSKYY